MPKQSKTDPLIKSMKQTYRKSAQSAWDTLLAEESRWKRKLTIAQNKLGEVRNRMNTFTQDLVKESDTGQKAETKPAPVEPETYHCDTCGVELDKGYRCQSCARLHGEP